VPAPILMICETISYKHEHLSIFYNPLKGREECVKVLVGGPRNGHALAHKLYDWENILFIDYDVPARHMKNAKTDYVYEHLAMEKLKELMA
jgi:hypothetical protein